VRIYQYHQQEALQLCKMHLWVLDNRPRDIVKCINQIITSGSVFPVDLFEIFGRSIDRGFPAIWPSPGGERRACANLRAV